MSMTAGDVMKVGDLVAYKLERKDSGRPNVHYRNPLGLGIIIKPDPAGCMFYVQWRRGGGWYIPETLEVVNENR